MRILLAFFLGLSACFAVDATAWGKLYEHAAESREQGKYVEARILFQECVAQAESFGGNDLRLAFSLSDLGNLETAFGKYREAESLLNRSVRILESLPNEKVLLSKALNNLSLVYLKHGKRYREAEKTQLRALDLAIEARGPKHLDVGSLLSNLAVSKARLGDRSGAMAYYERALALIPPGDSARAQTLGNLAVLSFESGNYQRSLGYLEEAIAGIQSTSGRDHPVLIAPLCNLAETHFVLNQWVAAEVALRRALAISDARMGQSDLLLPWILDSLAQVRRKAGDKKEAKALEIRAKRVESELGRRPIENSLVHVSELLNRRRK